jgi:DNA (cytosine-5)-methyltransferase 1
MSDLNTNEFAELFERIGKTPDELTDVLGVSARTVRRWESGEVKPKKSIIRLMREIVDNEYGNRKKPAEDNFTFIDLFAGIGGFRKGFETIGGKCIFTSEWDQNCRKTYLANYHCDHMFAGDITQIHEKDIPDHDLLLAGFPCQPFSIAGVSKKNALGKKHGFLCETQGTLFFDIARIIAHHQPATFVLENVKNLTSHDRGKTFHIIRKVLEEELGYDVHYRTIEAMGLVPQHRERIFMLGFRERVNFDFEIINIPSPDKGPKLKSILHPEDGSELPEEPYTYGPEGHVNEKYTLSPRLWKYLQEYAKKHKEKGNGFGFGLFGPENKARTLSARYYKDGSEILIKQNSRPRRLTPRECARLMGFDRPGYETMIIPVSDTQAYKQFGNAVVVPVVEAIAQSIAPYLYKLTGKTVQCNLPLKQVITHG